MHLSILQLDMCSLLTSYVSDLHIFNGRNVWTELSKTNKTLKE